MGIHDKDWIDLGEGEDIRWWNHPHPLNYIVEILLGVAIALGGILLIFGVIIDQPIGGISPWMWGLMLFAGGLGYVFYQFVRRGFHYYIVTNEKLIERRGILYEKRNPVHFNRMANTELERTMSERILSFLTPIDIADIRIETAGNTSVEMKLYNIPEANDVAQLIEEQMVNSGNSSSNMPYQNGGHGGQQHAQQQGGQQRQPRMNDGRGGQQQNQQQYNQQQNQRGQQNQQHNQRGQQNQQWNQDDDGGW